MLFQSVLLAASLFARVPPSAAQQDCSPPALDLSVMPGDTCALLKRICVYQGQIVAFDPSNAADNLTRANAWGGMEKNSGLWNFPSRGGTNSDALIGHMPNHYIPIRLASRMEADPDLQRPVFSTCTLPIFMLTDWPYNYGEVFAQLAPHADVLFRQKKFIDDRATLVMVTPMSLSATPFHHALLQRYSSRAVVGFDDMGVRPPPGARAAWSSEGTHVSCFERAVYCKFHGFPQPIGPTAAAIMEQILPNIPHDPLGFSPAGVSVSQDTILRVALEARTGAARTIRNLHQIVEECEAANKRGFRAGSFTGISCKVLQTGDTPTLHGVARFHANVGAVRAAHVLVCVHGAGCANSFFMENEGSTALMEIRPCLFGSKFAGWPDAYMRHQHEWSNDQIRFFAYNVEDPAQCAPSDYEAAALASPHNTPMRGSDAMRARDQHLTLRPEPLLYMFQHVASVLRNGTAWALARERNRMHGYPVAGGLLLGPLGVQNVSDYLAKGQGELIRL